MQIAAAEDLLYNVENLAIAVGDVLVTDISTNNIIDISTTIARNNIGNHHR